MEVIQNGSTPNDHLGLDTSQINDKLYIFLCGWKTHPSGHVVVFSSQFWDLSTLSLTPLTPLTHPPPEKNSNKCIQQGTNISPSQGIYLKMIFLFPLNVGFFWHTSPPRQGRRGVWAAAIPPRKIPWDPTRRELVVGSNDTNHSWKKGQLKKSIRKSPLNACSMKKIYITLV